jgi:NDP-sugar pyrophosphorylase family protein
MAAGIGSRYGTLKQIDRIGPSGETILDYSVYDALKAGFGKIVFIIRRDIEEDFRAVIFNKLVKVADVEYVFQELNDLPTGFGCPEGRIKPWGTGHAIWSARNAIKTPFAAINADDSYGAGAFKEASGFLSRSEDESTFCLIGYLLKNTLSEYGHVSRGVCMTDDDGFLTDIDERLKIQRSATGIVFTENEQQYPLEEDTVVSMNFWGFTPSLFDLLGEEFERFLAEYGSSLTAEFLIPAVVHTLICDHHIRVRVLKSHGQWFGMTYREDRKQVIQNISKLIHLGHYPSSLWD